MIHEPVSQFDEHGRYVGDNAANIPLTAAAAAASDVNVTAPVAVTADEVEVNSDSCIAITDSAGLENTGLDIDGQNCTSEKYRTGQLHSYHYLFDAYITVGRVQKFKNNIQNSNASEHCALRLSLPSPSAL